MSDTQNIPNANSTNSGLDTLLLPGQTTPSPASSVGSGLINYEGALLGVQQNSSSSSGSVPVDKSGMLEVWDLPKWLTGPNAPVIWYDTGHKTEHVPLNNGAPGIHGVLTDEINKTNSFDINKSAVDIMKQFAALSQTDPAQFAAVQKALAAGNFYGSASTIYGGWNSQTEKAIADAMVQYLKVSRGAGTPVSFMQFLANTAVSNQKINGNPGNGASSGSAANPPAGPSLTDPTQLQMMVQEAAQSALGQNLKPTQVQAFVNEFHKRETQTWQTMQNGGSAYVNPDASTSAASFVATTDPNQAKQHSIQGYTDAFLNMFVGGGSAAPSMTIDPALS